MNLPICHRRKNRPLNPLISHDITWNGGPGNTLDYPTSIVEYGTIPTPPGGTKTGYDLVFWSPPIVAATEAKHILHTEHQKLIVLLENTMMELKNQQIKHQLLIMFVLILQYLKELVMTLLDESPTIAPATRMKTYIASWKFINVPNLNSIANDCAFNSNDQYLVVAHETTPYVTIYKKGTNDTFSKINLTAPPGKAESCAFSPDGKYLAIGHQNAPGLTIYKKETGDNFSKLTMNTIEQDIALSCTFSKDSKYLAVTHLNAPSRNHLWNRTNRYIYKNERIK